MSGVLKRKILCSLLAASVFGVLYNPSADAAVVNGSSLQAGEDGVITITDKDLLDAGSKKFVFGQGDKINLVTKGDVNKLIKDLQAAVNLPGKKEKLAGIRKALADNAVVGVIGGDGQLDTGFTGLLKNNIINGLLSGKGLPIDKIIRLDTAKGTDSLSKDGSANVVIGSADASSVVIGVVGGDLSVNSGLNGKILDGWLGKFSAQPTDIVRNGDTNVTINNGNILGGVGSSAAVAVGNINGEFSAQRTFMSFPVTARMPFEFKGKTITTVNGDANLTITDGANVAGWANGGLAVGIGGEATSVVTGSSNIRIDSNVKTDGALDGITTFISGGGAALTTIGGKAKTEVGKVKIDIHNGLSAGIIGSGIAGAIDAAGLLGKGNDAGYSDITDEQLEKLLGLQSGIPKGKIVINGAIEGGEAAARTGDTHLTLTGNTAAAGVMGGGIAVASHTYTNRDNTDGSTENNGTPGGSSLAKAETGKAHIVVNLEGEHNTAQLFKGVGGLKKVFGNLAAGKETAAIASLKDALKDAEGQSSVVLLAGGGMAAAHGDSNSSAATSTAGADIDLVNGYATGIFGGSVALADNNAKAEAAMTDDINIYIRKDMETVGVFGNGLAYFTGSAAGGQNNLTGLASVTAANTSIKIAGMADGVIGGGIAIDDSQADRTNASVHTNGKAEVSVLDGAEVHKLNFAPLIALAGRSADDSINLASYVKAVKAAAEDVAISGGGVAVGGGAESYVKNAEINIYGGTVNGDIIGGGVAVYGHEENDGAAHGSHVENSMLNLYGGTVKGDVYAGGSASAITTGGTGYDKALARVDKAVVNLAGAVVEGTFSGQGKSGKAADAAGHSTLNVTGENTLTAVDNASKISGFNRINFAENSVTTVNGLTAGNDVAFIDGSKGTISVADSARLNISELAKDGENAYYIAGNYAADSSLWNRDQLAYDRTKGYASVSETNGKYEVSYKELTQLNEKEKEEAVDAAAGSFGRFGRSARGIIEGILINADETNKGAAELFSDLTASDNQAKAQQGLYTGMMLGEDSGVTGNAVAMAQDFADNAFMRLSLAQDDVSSDEKGSIWAKYLRNKHKVDGMNSSAGKLTASSSYDGVMVGAEFAQKGKLQAGIAFAYGEGDGSGLTTRNDFDMWGISLYGNVKNADSNIIGDIGFSRSSNKITSSVMDENFNSERDLNIFTMGVRAEKVYTAGNTRIVPYAGLRYMSVDADSYSAAYKSGDAFRYDADNQNIWTMPLGVSLRNETVTAGGWSIIPKLDVAYILAFGDTDNNVTVNAGSGSSVLSYDVMDSGSWLTSVGIAAGKGDWSCGVGYTYQKGSHAENNKWFANVNYSF